MRRGVHPLLTTGFIGEMCKMIWTYWKWSNILIVIDLTRGTSIALLEGAFVVLTTHFLLCAAECSFHFCLGLPGLISSQTMQFWFRSLALPVWGSANASSRAVKHSGYLPSFMAAFAAVLSGHVTSSFSAASLLYSKDLGMADSHMHWRLNSNNIETTSDTHAWGRALITNTG